MAVAANRDRIFAIVLAAGAASRFGATKQTAAWNGSTLVRRAGELATGCCDARTILVTGHDWQHVRAAYGALPGGFVVNENYADGIGSSLALAVRSIRHAAAAVLVTLADQPLITSAHLDGLIAAWSGGADEIIASGYAEANGVPALFGPGCFDALCELRADEGAKKLMHDSTFAVTTIPFADAAADVDTADDLVRIARSARS